MLNPQLLEKLKEIIYPVAELYEVESHYWIQGDDEFGSYCYDHAQEKITELEKEFPDDEFQLDGGWRIDSDSQAFCETCGIALDNGFTDYCSRTEIEHFEENGFDYTNPSDCYSLTQILNSFEGTDEEDRIYKLATSIVTRFETAIWQRKSDPLGLMPLMMIGTVVLLSPLMLITLLIASAIIPFKYLATFLSDKIFIMLTVTRD
jgi:hypothetical protein